MRLALALAALIIAAMPATAADNTLAINVDRVYLSGSYVVVLVRAGSKAERMISEAKVECAVFDSERKAVGRGLDFPERIAPGQTVVGEVTIEAPPDTLPTGLTAECRVLSIK